MMSYDEKINFACRETSPRYPASLKTWGSRVKNSNQLNNMKKYILQIIFVLSFAVSINAQTKTYAAPPITYCNFYDYYKLNDICKNYLHAELNSNDVKLDISEEIAIERFNKTFIYKLDTSDNIAFTIRNLEMKNKKVIFCTIAEEPIVTLDFYKSNSIVYNCNGLIDGVYFAKYTDDFGNIYTNKIIITRL